MRHLLFPANIALRHAAVFSHKFGNLRNGGISAHQLLEGGRAEHLLPSISAVDLVAGSGKNMPLILWQAVARTCRWFYGRRWQAHMPLDVFLVLMKASNTHSGELVLYMQAQVWLTHGSQRLICLFSNDCA